MSRVTKTLPAWVIALLWVLSYSALIQKEAHLRTNANRSHVSLRSTFSNYHFVFGHLPTFLYASYLLPFVCLLFFPHDFSKIDAARITKLDTKCSNIGSGNPFILKSKGQRSRSRVTKTLPAWIITLLCTCTEQVHRSGSKAVQTSNVVGRANKIATDF